MVTNINSSFEDDKIPLVVPVIKEKLHISTINEVTGSVKMTKTVAEEEVPYSIELQSERLETRTIPFNTWIEEPVPAIRQEGDTTVISVTKEVLVVEKRLMLVEEIHIVRIKETRLEKGSETVRTETVNVTRSAAN